MDWRCTNPGPSFGSLRAGFLSSPSSFPISSWLFSAYESVSVYDCCKGALISEFKLSFLLRRSWKCLSKCVFSYFLSCGSLTGNFQELRGWEKLIVCRSSYPWKFVTELLDLNGGCVAWRNSSHRLANMCLWTIVKGFWQEQRLSADDDLETYLIINLNEFLARTWC